jgi:hypothetical protein
MQYKHRFQIKKFHKIKSFSKAPIHNSKPKAHRMIDIKPLLIIIYIYILILNINMDIR